MGGIDRDSAGGVRSDHSIPKIVHGGRHNPDGTLGVIPAQKRRWLGVGRFGAHSELVRVVKVITHVATLTARKISRKGGRSRQEETESPTVRESLIKSTCLPKLVSDYKLAGLKDSKKDVLKKFKLR